MAAAAAFPSFDFVFPGIAVPGATKRIESGAPWTARTTCANPLRPTDSMTDGYACRRVIGRLVVPPKPPGMRLLERGDGSGADGSGVLRVASVILDADTTVETR